MKSYVHRSAGMLDDEHAEYTPDEARYHSAEDVRERVATCRAAVLMAEDLLHELLPGDSAVRQAFEALAEASRPDVHRVTHGARWRCGCGAQFEDLDDAQAHEVRP